MRDLLYAIILAMLFIAFPGMIFGAYYYGKSEGRKSMYKEFIDKKAFYKDGDIAYWQPQRAEGQCGICHLKGDY